MIYLIDSRNNLIGPLGSWNCVKPQDGIRKLILTDKAGFYRELFGYDSYYASKEAISGISCSPGGPVKTTSNVKLSRESIYGIHDLTRARAELLKEFNNHLAVISNCQEDVIDRLNSCRDKYNNLLQKLNRCEVRKISLIVEVENDSMQKFPEIDTTWVKAGEKMFSRSAEYYLGKRYGKNLKA
jgi:hypothetical protein